MACALRSEDGTLCPSSYDCTAVPGSTQAVCCLKVEEESETENYNLTETRPQTSKFIDTIKTHPLYLSFFT